MEMEKLLKALQANREDLVTFLAAEAFFNKDMSTNQENVDKFKAYSGLKVYVAANRVLGFKAGWIIYNEKKFYFA